MKTPGYILALTVAISLALPRMSLASTDADIVALQERWDHLEFGADATEKEEAFARLNGEAENIVAAHPESAEALFWSALAEISYAGATRGLSALRHIKAARKKLERAIAIDPRALDGGAYTMLGSLYYMMPGPPIGFGDNDKALELLRKGLDIAPDNIDANFFYGDFLLATDRPDEAEKVLRKALQAPARPGREIADEGRRADIRRLLDRIAESRQ